MSVAKTVSTEAQAGILTSAVAMAAKRGKEIVGNGDKKHERHGDSVVVGKISSEIVSSAKDLNGAVKAVTAKKTVIREAAAICQSLFIGIQHAVAELAAVDTNDLNNVAPLKAAAIEAAMKMGYSMDVATAMVRDLRLHQLFAAARKAKRDAELAEAKRQAENEAAELAMYRAAAVAAQKDKKGKK